MSDRTGRAPDEARMRTRGSRLPRWAPSLSLLLIAIAGHYSLARAGVAAPAWVDLRTVGITGALTLLAYDLRSGPVSEPGEGSTGRREGWLVALALFFLYQVGSAVWAPAGARVGETSLDIVLVATLTFALYAHARRQPLVVARRALWFFYVVSVVFALGGLALSNPGAQGRYAAFGGGPNIFVRFEVLGIIAAVALVAVGGKRWILLPTPLLVVGAVLSGSRGGLVAFLVVGLGAAIALRGRARRLILRGFAAVFAVVLVAYAFSFGSGLIETRFVEQTVEQGYTSDRVQIWGDTLHLAVDNPIVGAGLDGYYGLVGRHVGMDYPHNYLLAVVGEGGLIGVTLLVLALTLWLRTVRTGQNRAVEGQALLASAAFVAIASAFSGGYYDARLAWIFAALAAAMFTSPPPAAEENTPAGDRGRSRRLDARAPLGT